MKSKRLAKIVLTLFTFLFLFFQYGIQEAQAWWSSNYSYRKRITVTNNDSVQLAANTIGSFTADTQALISGSKLRSDGKDWRIVYYNGSTESEIAQNIETGWNSSSTETWFRLQAAINAGASDGNYYLYYGYSSESTSPSSFTTTEQTLTQQLTGSGQREESFDWNSTPEYGSAQQVSIGAGTSRYWKITRFSIYVNHKTGSTCSDNDIAGFIFSGTNKREGDQITNGKSDLKDGDTFSANSWNDLSWSGDKPKIKTGTWYIAVLPTNPAQRSASGCFVRWDFTAVVNYYAYEIQKDSSTWLTTNCANKERVYKVYGREAANSDLSTSLRGETNESEWWDYNYGLRKQITITAPASKAVPSGYPVKLTIDHASLVSASPSKSQADGDDIRVVRWDGSNWVEVDRILFNNGITSSSWNQSNTQIVFKTQASVSAGSSDSSYYLYYSNPSAANPPTSTLSSRYFLAESTSETQTTSTSYASKVQLQFTPSSTSEHWVVACTWRQRRVGNADTLSYAGKGQVRLNGSTARTGNDLITYMMAGNIFKTFQVFFKVTGTTSQQTVNIDFASLDGNNSGIDNARILAFMIPDPSNANIQYSETLTKTTDSTNPTNAQTLTFTPSSQGEYIWMANGFCHEAPGGDTNGGLFAKDETSTDQQQTQESYIDGGVTYKGFVPFIHFQKTNNLTASSKSFIIRHQPDSTTGSERQGLTQLLFRADPFDTVETASATSSSSTTQTTYQSKNSLTTASVSSNQDFVYLAVMNLYTTANDITRSTFGEIRLASTTQLEEEVAYDRNTYYRQIAWAWGETTTGNRAIDSRYKAESGITAYAQYAQIVSLRYIEPSTTLGSEAQPTAVMLSSFTATEYEEGRVLLQWRTGYEADNLGFHVYREGGGQLYQLTSEPIKGSALMTGPDRITAGYSYSWWDTSSGQRSAVGGRQSSSRYWLEDIDLSGTKTMHGPVTPVFSHKPVPQRAQSILLSQINRQGVGGRVSGVGAEARSQHPAVSGQRSAPPPLPSPLEGEGRGGGASSGALPKPGVPRANIAVSSMDERNETPAGRKIFTPLSDKPLKKSSEVQQALAGSQAVKIYIQEEGWYRVTRPELVAAGLDPAVNPRFLQLFVGGEEQPILVKRGRDDRLGPRDSIEFYAQGLDTPYTETRVYWLVDGSRPGKRIHKVGEIDSGTRISSFSFPYTVEKKDRTIYIAALKNGEKENFFGAVVAPAPVDQVLKVSHLGPSPPGDAVLEVSLQGVTAGTHWVRVFLNETEVGKMVFDDQVRKLATFPVFQSGLVEGENVVRLVALGSPVDVSLVDYIRLTYWRKYTAEEDALRFTATGGGFLSVNGFSSSSVRVVDISNPKSVLEVEGLVQWEGEGYSIRFRVPGQGQRTMLAFMDEEVKKPAAMVANQPSRWHQTGNRSDLVIISHWLFLESLKPLKALREAQGLSVALLDVEDLYDEFSFGIKTPQALKDFLLRAKSSWQKPPRFVLLVGDASFDPRNYYGFGNFDFVPTKLVDTAYIETASDDWFVDFDGDGLADMAIGRIPVRTAEEAAVVVSKVVGYEQTSSRMKDVLLVADMKDEEFDFPAASLQVKALLPGSLMVHEVYRDHFSDDVQVKGELLRKLNQGPLVVNYLGHGTLEFWRGDVFGSDDAEALVNGLRLPFVIAMTCLNGFFQDVYYETLAESLLKARRGGAVAVWTSSGLTLPGRQAVMNQALIRLLFNGEGLTIGEAVMRAKAATNDPDVRKTWILFGDPTTRLK